MTQPTARDLLAAAIHEEWHDADHPCHDTCPSHASSSASRILATPSGQHLAAIVDAAVDAVLNLDYDGFLRAALTDAIDAALAAQPEAPEYCLADCGCAGGQVSERCLFEPSCSRCRSRIGDEDPEMMGSEEDE